MRVYKKFFIKKVHHLFELLLFKYKSERSNELNETKSTLYEKYPPEAIRINLPLKRWRLFMVIVQKRDIIRIDSDMQMRSAIKKFIYHVTPLVEEEEF